jgi:hypothetical protein
MAPIAAAGLTPWREDTRRYAPARRSNYGTRKLMLIGVELPAEFVAVSGGD